MSLILTPEELADLTDRKQPKRQMEWLVQHKWPFDVSAAGLPKVARDYFDLRMGVTEARQKKRIGPRLEGLNRQVRRAKGEGR